MRLPILFHTRTPTSMMQDTSHPALTVSTVSHTEGLALVETGGNYFFGQSRDKDGCCSMNGVRSLKPKCWASSRAFAQVLIHAFCQLIPANDVEPQGVLMFAL